MDDVSQQVVFVASFAHSIAKGYAARGGDPADAFGAFAGLIAEQDPEMARVTLKALDEVLSRKNLHPTGDR